MKPCGVAIVTELVQFADQIPGVPERGLVEILAPKRPIQPFDKGMRSRSVRSRLDLLDPEDAQVGKPAQRSSG